MVDAPDPSVTAVHVTIDRVEAHIDGEWKVVTAIPKGFNLFDLMKAEVVLGTASLPVGHYTQVRFFPSAASVTDGAGTHNMRIPSGLQTGVKVNLDYDILPDRVTTILLDFNAAKSIIKQGNGQYQMQPVVSGVVKVLSGTVTGQVKFNGAPVKGAEIKATYTTGTQYPIGTEVNTTLSTEDGTFKVWMLLPGTYTITASYTDPVAGVKTATKTGVVVAADQNTDIGVLNLL